MNYPVNEYENISYHGGVNERLNARRLSDIEATELLNVDISVPGIRTKRLDPTTADDLLQPTVPATPSASVDSLGVCAVTITWGAVVGAETYEIKLYLGPDCVAAALLSTDEVASNITEFTFTGLSGGTTYSYTVQAFGDGNNYADSNVSSCGQFTTGSIDLDDELPDGVVGTAYTGTITVSGDGTGPYTIAVSSGTIPSGLSFLDNGDGTATISGTPDTADTYTFAVTATDDNGCTGSRAYEVVIDDPVPTSCPGAPPAGGLADTYYISDETFTNWTNGGGDTVGTCTVSETASNAADHPDYPVHFSEWDRSLGISGSCSWQAPQPTNDLELNGKLIRPGSKTKVALYNYGGTWVWLLQITGTNLGPPVGGAERLSWYAKYGGLTPVGEYTALCAASGPQTVTVSETP